MSGQGKAQKTLRDAGTGLTVADTERFLRFLEKSSGAIEEIRCEENIPVWERSSKGHFLGAKIKAGQDQKIKSYNRQWSKKMESGNQLETQNGIYTTIYIL